MRGRPAGSIVDDEDVDFVKYSGKDQLPVATFLVSLVESENAESRRTPSPIVHDDDLSFSEELGFSPRKEKLAPLSSSRRYSFSRNEWIQIALGSSARLSFAPLVSDDESDYQE